MFRLILVFLIIGRLFSDIGATGHAERLAGELGVAD